MGRVVFWLGNDAGGGKPLPLIENPVAMFDSEHEVDWLNTQLGKDIIEAVDDSVHIKDRIIESTVLGCSIPPEDLSCGCKMVLLAAFHPDVSDLFFDGSKMGDNCYPVLFKVARETKRNVKVRVGRLLRESWGESEEVLFMPKNDSITGYMAAFDYLAANTKLFYKGDRYGAQG